MKKPLRSYAANGFKIRGPGQAIRVLSSEARKIRLSKEEIN